jgi:uncharacterized membrane protein
MALVAIVLHAWNEQISSIGTLHDSKKECRQFDFLVVIVQVLCVLSNIK